ncbi:uncharacterized protein LOC105699655 [Orussus abietinus]|uniref:uncharacterized protein LOC105699655 n=1 Tax=Orussus abietinus TaxID=222816 RepID=UPI000626224A|nr:uncharacterized protein LOC105699655 [Orussus abietinus]
MRILPALYRGRFPQNEAKVKFIEQLPLNLRNKISSKGNSGKERGCLYEITLLLNCLQTNAFEEKLCSKEVMNFEKCYDSYITKSKVNKEMQKKGILVPGSKMLTHKQLNVLFKKYPHETRKM